MFASSLKVRETLVMLINIDQFARVADLLKFYATILDAR